MRRIDSLFNEMNLRLFTTLSEEREILKNFSKEITLLREENKSLKDQIYNSSLPKSTKSTKTQTIAVTKELNCEAGIVAKETITIDNSESLVTANTESDNNNSTNMINQLNKVRSDKRTEYYAHKKATASHKVSFNIPIQQGQTKVQKTKGILTQSKISNSQPQIIHPSTQKPGNIDMTAGNVTTNKNHTWAPGTTLIIGDSMIGGIRETQIAPRKNIKVRSFAGATVRDMEDYVLPLLRKKPSCTWVQTMRSNQALTKL